MQTKIMKMNSVAVGELVEGADTMSMTDMVTAMNVMIKLLNIRMTISRRKEQEQEQEQEQEL